MFEKPAWRSGLVFFLCALVAIAAEPMAGLRLGQRPGPYAAVQSTGEHRGQSYCYICETAERPFVVVFARSLSDPLGKLVHQLDKAVMEHPKAELRAWVTFLSKDQTGVDPQVVQWS